MHLPFFPLHHDREQQQGDPEIQVIHEVPDQNESEGAEFMNDDLRMVEQPFTGEVMPTHEE
ncbi:hypothetical protein [Chitinophaga sp. CB10]|uniref:hypothetical protein n=1 Tax=Chitinophaga sp. CB10 TaxID=1891659 RepID=UPI0025C6118F|nr:hypothetical protein [Chitinophaga sp. CB10]